MRTVYRVLAFLVALGVVVQGGAIAYAFFGLSKWVEQGGVLDAASSGPDSTLEFAGVGGFMIHGMSGTMIIPALAVLLLISSFFAKVPGGVRWALFVFGAVIVQVALGIFGHEITFVGLLHGGFALVLFGLAVTAGIRARVTSPAAAATEPVHV